MRAVDVGVLAWFAAFVAVTACGPRHPPGWVGVDNAAPCELACSHLEMMGCDVGKPTAKGSSCLDICRNGNKAEYLPMPTTCLANAPDCKAAADCR